MLCTKTAACFTKRVEELLAERGSANLFPASRRGLNLSYLRLEATRSCSIRRRVSSHRIQGTLATLPGRLAHQSNVALVVSPCGLGLPLRRGLFATAASKTPSPARLAAPVLLSDAFRQGDCRLRVHGSALLLSLQPPRHCVAPTLFPCNPARIQLLHPRSSCNMSARV